MAQLFFTAMLVPRWQKKDGRLLFMLREGEKERNGGCRTLLTLNEAGFISASGSLTTRGGGEGEKQGGNLQGRCCSSTVNSRYT